MLDIVIVNWNAGEMLAQAVLSAAQASAGSAARVIVVDNASTDGSVAHLLASARREGTKVEVVQNGENRGFAAACNQGARLGTGEFILFLNPDTLLHAGCLEEPLQFLADPLHRQVGICGIRLLDETGRTAVSCARFPTAGIFLAQALGLNRLRRFAHLGHLMNEWDHACNREVDQVIGAFFMVRRTLYSRLGGFDERFFVYFEEVDFSLRARQAGSSSVFLAQPCATHVGGGSTRSIKARRLAYSLRSRLQYFGKHFGAGHVAAIWAITFAIELPARLLLALSRGSARELLDTARGYALAIRQLLAGGPTR